LLIEYGPTLQVDIDILNLKSHKVKNPNQINKKIPLFVEVTIQLFSPQIDVIGPRFFWFFHINTLLLDLLSIPAKYPFSFPAINKLFIGLITLIE
jgi:hypothetical protein